MSDALYATTSTAFGGREGRAVSEDGKLDLQLSVPGVMGGDNGPGTNPEQLFATGFSACFHGALKNRAGALKVNADDSAVSVTVNFLPDGDGFKIGADIEASIPNAAPDDARRVLEAAHEFCPYSKATRGNIEVKLSLAEND